VFALVLFVIEFFDPRVESEELISMIYVMLMFYLHLIMYVYVVWTQLKSGRYDGLFRITEVYYQMASAQDVMTEYRALRFVSWYSKRVFWIVFGTMMATMIVAYYLWPMAMTAQ